MTKEQANKKYAGKYVEMAKSWDYQSNRWDYEIKKTSKTIRENMTRGEDIGTEMEYRR